MVVTLGASAQDSLSIRFGYLSYEQALQSMPEYKAARENTDKLWGQYEAELKRVEDEFNRKYEDFLDGQRDFPKTILRKRQTELQELMTKNIAFKEDSRRQLAEAEAEAIAPLKEKLNAAIAKIAKERGYAFVINTDAEACPYINPQMGDDISELVTKSLQR